jgi:hypothetical protein
MDFENLMVNVKATTTFQNHNHDVSKPQHPGRFCSQGCFAQLFNYGADDLWERLEKDRAARETASILVRLLTPDTAGFDAYKIYLDGYIRKTAPRKTTQEYCELIELPPGEHILIVRDYDHRNPRRRESNHIKFSIRDSECIEFQLSDKDSHLSIRQKSESEPYG